MYFLRLTFWNLKINLRTGLDGNNFTIPDDKKLFAIDIPPSESGLYESRCIRNTTNEITYQGI